MTQETEVVKEGEPNLEEPTPQEEQDTPVEDDVQSPVSDVQDNLRKALQKERERRKAAEAQLQQQQYQPPQYQDEAVVRFNNVEATTLINNKLLTDPSFKDRADLVQNEMIRTGKTLEDADNAVLAGLFRDMTLESAQSNPSLPIKQLKTTATPEEKPTISKEVQDEIDMFDKVAKSFGD